MLINGDRIGSLNPQAPANQFSFSGALVAATDDTVGGVFKVQNTTGVDIIVTHMLVDVTTAASTGTPTIDIGVHDKGTSSDDTLIDGMNPKTVKVHTNYADAGTNGGVAVWKNGEFIVATASATVVALVGKYKILGYAR